jgi:cbb3-type cytochrome oxidase subunit 3
MDAPQTTTPAQPAKRTWPIFVGSFALFVLFAGFVQWMLATSDRAAFDEEAIRAQERYEILAKINEENAKLTEGYAWSDPAKKTVQLPLERAMELTVQRLAAQGEPKPVYPIDPSVPLGSAVKPGGLAAPQPTPPPFSSVIAPASEEVVVP